ncbi:MAG TPA: hypothetical protein VFL12_05015 [Thermoanaerobaculia bacterium]|nr:hypothetical protein [Thermoanaerobaculia bacterium]
MNATNAANILFEYTLNVTSVTEYGMSLAALASGQALPPPEGARFDIVMEGSVSGPRIEGAVKAIDYARVRADGRFDLHIHAEITTGKGSKIALFSDGVAIVQPGSPIVELRENISLFASAEDDKWVNPLQVWGVGTVDLVRQVIHVKGYSAS